MELNSKAIGVLFYLKGHPNSSEKDIMVDMQEFSSRAEVKNIVDNLSALGVIKLKNKVLFSLTETGKVLTGGNKPSAFLLEQMKKRGLPTKPFSPSDGRFNDKKGFAPRVNAKVVRTQPLDAHKPGGVDDSVLQSIRRPSPLLSRNDEEKKPAASSFSKEQSGTAQKSGSNTQNKTEINNPKEKRVIANNSPKSSPKIYHFTMPERDLLSSLSKGVEVAVTKSDEVHVKALESRGFVFVKDGKLSLSISGKYVLKEEGLLPFTRYFNLSKAERIAVELILPSVYSKNSFMLRAKDIEARFKSNGLSTSDDFRLDVIASLKSKGIIHKRKNKMWYFKKGFSALCGLYRGSDEGTARAEMKDIVSTHPGLFDLKERDISGSLDLAEQYKSAKVSVSKKSDSGKATTASKPKAPNNDTSHIGGDYRDRINEVKEKDVVESQKQTDTSHDGSDKKAVDPADFMAEVDSVAEKLTIEPFKVSNLDAKVNLLSAIRDKLFASPESPSAAIIGSIIDDLNSAK
jgi:hypothetical protein